MQKEGPSAVQSPISVVANGTASPEKPADRAKRLRGLKDSIEETKVLLSFSVIVRLSEFLPVVPSLSLCLMLYLYFCMGYLLDITWCRCPSKQSII